MRGTVRGSILRYWVKYNTPPPWPSLEEFVTDGSESEHESWEASSEDIVHICPYMVITH